MPFPLIGAGIAALGRSVVGRFAKKAAGKALRSLTAGRLIGQGGGAIAARRIATAAGAAATVATTYTAMRPPRAERLPEYVPGEGGEWKLKPRSRRMNPMNVRALRKAVRRIGSAEKLFRKVFTISGGKVTPRLKRGSR